MRTELDAVIEAVDAYYAMEVGIDHVLYAIEELRLAAEAEE